MMAVHRTRDMGFSSAGLSAGAAIAAERIGLNTTPRRTAARTRSTPSLVWSRAYGLWYDAQRQELTRRKREGKQRAGTPGTIKT